MTDFKEKSPSLQQAKSLLTSTHLLHLASPTFSAVVISSSEEMVIRITHIINRTDTGLIVTITEILFTASVM